MAINTTTFESTLQTKLNDTTLAAKEMLLLGKALESTVGSIAVSDINTAGATKVAEINTVATNTFKTVGGTTILGSGDIATLPSGGSVGQVLKKDGSNNASWGADEGGKVLQVIYANTGTYTTATTSSYFTVSGFTQTITPTSTNSKILVTWDVISGSDNHATNYCIPQMQIVRNGTAVFENAPQSDYGQWQASATPMVYLDSPNTTSSVTYTLQARGIGPLRSMFFNGSYNQPNGTAKSTLIIMEIGA